MTPPSGDQRSASLAGPIVANGFAAAVALWTAWFFTHLPWLGLPESVSMPCLVAIWLLVTAFLSLRVPPAARLRAGAGAGLVTALLGLAIVGSKLRPAQSVAGSPEADLVPQAWIISLAFLAAGGVVGALASAIVLKVRQPESPANWLGRLAIWVTLSVAPLIFVGGLVTSTNSGLAVPDWPNTFGTNMFLYPIGPRAPGDVFLEHSHRLFGTLAGTGLLILSLWTCLRGATPSLRTRFLAVFGVTLVGVLAMLGLRVSAADGTFASRWGSELALALTLAGIGVAGAILVSRTQPGDRWTRVWSLVLLAVIVVQGYMGGMRVEAKNQGLAMVHGVAAQALLGGLAMLATYLSTAFTTLPGTGGFENTRRARALATAAMHSLLLQLVLGAWYRHFPSPHVLWTHVVFSVVVSIAAMLAGFAAGGIRGEDVAHPAARAASKLGVAVGVAVALQFILGWIAFMARGDTNAVDPVRALLRTAHQANGALLIGLTSGLFVLVRRIHLSARAGAVPPQ